MPKNKNAFIRYRIIDSCLRNPRHRFPDPFVFIEACGGLGTVSLRTIEKDIYDMRYDEELKYHAPIEYSKIEKGYYYSDKDFSINKLPLREEDIGSIEFACSILKQFDGIAPVQQFMRSVSKIEEYVNINQAIGSNEWDNIIQTEKRFNDNDGINFLTEILTSIKNKTKCRLHYKRFNQDKAKQYIYHPYVLKEYRNRWYVTGLSESNSMLVTFALDRINKIEIIEETFERISSFKAPEYFKYSFGITSINKAKPIDVILSFKPTQAAYLKSQPLHQSQKILIDDDQELRIGIKVYNTYELKSAILSNGSDVKIIEPEELRLEIKQILSEALNKY